MLTVDEALRLLVSHAGRQPIQPTPLPDALGLVLAQPVVSDIDSPPFTKALMDGFAVRNEDMQQSRPNLRIAGELTAGGVHPDVVPPGHALRIMTGAPMPPGADAVVMVERSSVEGDRAILDDPSFRPNQNVMPQGLELKWGETVLEPGAVLGPAECGLLATVGCVLPMVHRRIRVSVLSTGDEVVDPEQTPGPGQLRNSNASTLVALCQGCRCEVTNLGIVADDVSTLEQKVAQGLQSDLLLLTGGVSAGTKDFVPKVLQALGVEQIFHKVDLKPGKPVWFGKHPKGLVFGLPGNPVSVLACFEIFVKTALRARLGMPNPLPKQVLARLKHDWAYPTRRETFHPAKLSLQGSQLVVEPVHWHGSPDLRALTRSNALLRLPVTEQPVHPAGTSLWTLPLTHGQADPLAILSSRDDDGNEN